MTGDAARGPLFSLESQLLDWVQAAVIVTDLNGEVVFANPFCEVLYGRGPDELIGVDAKCFAIDPLAPDLLADIGREILNGRTWEGEFRVERADGTAVRGARGRLAGVRRSGHGRRSRQPRVRRDRGSA